MEPLSQKQRFQRFSLVAIILVFFLKTAIGSARAQSKSLLQEQQTPRRMHTLFSVECNNYFDWQTVGLMNSYRRSGQPGPITRLLSCTEADLAEYQGMDLAPTHVVPSMSRHPKTGDWYPAINKPAGVLHWLQNNTDAKNVDWVVILDADMIIRHPIIPWELGAEKGKPVAAAYGYLIGCDNILAELHTKHPEYCDKVGGLLVMHMDDLRALAPLWLSKTEEVRGDRAHWATNITGDIFAEGWISEMYGYSFGAAEVGLRHKISDDLMIYPGYIPREGVEPILMHYGLRFSVGDWSFSKADHHEDGIVYNCNQLFPAPPYPKEVLALEKDQNKLRGLFLSIECMNSLNEGLLVHHEARGCSSPPRSKYIGFMKVWRASVRKLLHPGLAKMRKTGVVIDNQDTMVNIEQTETSQTDYDQLTSTTNGEVFPSSPRIHTLFSAECSTYFDWQTVGLVHSFGLSGQPGSITRLLSCSEEQLRTYKGMDLAPTHLVPSYSLHPLTNDWYPAINKPAAVLHWLNHVQTDAEFLIIIDADMIFREPITPWDFSAEKGHPVSVPYDYLIGCANILAKIHTRYPEACDKVGGVVIMHIDDLRVFAPLWLHKTEEVRADREHWSTNITGDIYGQGWISEMYGYAFGAAELKLRHRIRSDIMLYPGYIPPEGIEPRILHYGLEFTVGNWSFDKASWREEDMVNVCWKFFPDPPDLSSLTLTNPNELKRDTISVECIRTINNALYLHHKRRGCPENNEEATTKPFPPPLPSFEKDLKEVSQFNGGKIHEGDENTERIQEWNTNLDKEVSFDTKELQVITTNSTTLEAKPSHKDSIGSVMKGQVIAISPTYWMVALWTILVFAFLLIVSSVYSSHGQKQKSLKSKGKRYTTGMTSNGESYRVVNNAA